MKESNIFLTGLPGSGKSTILLRCIEKLKPLGLAIGGISTPEIRHQGQRVGFKVVDLASKKEAVLAGVEVSSKHRVGKYGVNISGFESVALPALRFAEDHCDIICIDEIGRMEFFSTKFKLKINEIIDGAKPLISVLHRKYVREYGSCGRVFRVTPENRELLPKTLVENIEKHFKKNREISD
jgi:nucleoside-triphosphatase